MEEPQVPLPDSPVCVVGPRYCAPHPTNIEVEEKFTGLLIMNEFTFVVTDSNGHILFKVKDKVGLFQIPRVLLLDAAGNPIITMRSKARSMHDRWQVFRGKSTDSKDMIFSVKRSSVFQLKNKLHVFMANNRGENMCDFHIEGSRSLKSCTIYLGQSSTIIAQMRKTRTSLLFGRDKYMIMVYPNVDFAFIVTLIVILHEMNRSSSSSS